MCGHRQSAATAACLFLCRLMGFLLRLEIIQGPELLPEEPLQLWKLIYRAAIWISIMVKCPGPINKKNMSVTKHHNPTAAGLGSSSGQSLNQICSSHFKLGLQYCSFEYKFYTLFHLGSTNLTIYRNLHEL